LLDRPQSKNAVTLKMWQELAQAIAEVSASTATCLVVRGANGCFSAGVDLRELAELASLNEARNYWGKIKEALKALSNLKIPSVALIEGYCLGGGLLLALACDLRFATNSAQFSLPIAKLGICLDSETIAALVDQIGESQAKRLLFTGDTISGAQAFQMGLADEVLEAHFLEDFVSRQVSSICQNDLASVAQIKQQMRSLSRSPQSSTGQSGTASSDAMHDDRLVAKSLIDAKVKEAMKKLVDKNLPLV